MDTEAVHRLILCYDVQESTKLDNDTGHMMRERLVDACMIAAAAADVPSSAITTLGRGDGAMLLLDADVPKKRILDVWLRAFHGHLQDAYMQAEPRIQIRLAVHAGEVQPSLDDFQSPDLSFAARLVDAPAAKRILKATPSSPLAVIVSEGIYRQVVRPSGATFDPAAYSRIPIDVKETHDAAWIHLPGWARVPIPDEPPEQAAAGASPGQAAAARPGQVFNGDVGVVGTNSGGTFNFGGAR